MKNLKAFTFFTVAGLIHMLWFDVSRDMVAQAFLRGYDAFGIGLLIGGASWYFVPGMLCLWLATKGNHVNWLAYSGVNLFAIVVLCALYSTFNFVVILVMGSLVGLVNSFILCKLMGFRATKPETIDLGAELSEVEEKDA